MADEPPNLVLELLRAMRGDMAEMREDVQEVLTRMSRLEEGQARGRRDQAGDAETLAHLQAQMDRMREEVARIKRRLDILD